MAMRSRSLDLCVDHVENLGIFSDVELSSRLGDRHSTTSAIWSMAYGARLRTGARSKAGENGVVADRRLRDFRRLAGVDISQAELELAARADPTVD